MKLLFNIMWWLYGHIELYETHDIWVAQAFYRIILDPFVGDIQKSRLLTDYYCNKIMLKENTSRYSILTWQFHICWHPHLFCRESLHPSEAPCCCINWGSAHMGTRLWLQNIGWCSPPESQMIKATHSNWNVKGSCILQASFALVTCCQELTFPHR